MVRNTFISTWTQYKRQCLNKLRFFCTSSLPICWFVRDWIPSQSLHFSSSELWDCLWRRFSPRLLDACYSRVAHFGKCVYLYYYIGQLSTKICPRKSVLKIGPISSRALAIRHRSWRRFWCAYRLPIRDHCASAFCVCPLFFTTKNHK